MGRYGWVEGEVSGIFWEISENLGEISEKFPENGPDLLKFTEITEILKSLKIQYN